MRLTILFDIIVITLLRKSVALSDDATNIQANKCAPSFDQMSNISLLTYKLRDFANKDHDFSTRAHTTISCQDEDLQKLVLEFANLLSSCCRDTSEENVNQLKDIAKTNRDILEGIINNMNENVTCGYTYSIVIDHSKETEQNDEPWKLGLEPVTKSIESLVYDWDYTGQELEVIDDIFYDHIDYTLHNISDVIRLNRILLEVGLKFSSHLNNCHSTKTEMSKIIANIKKLNVAVAELYQLTINVKDIMSEDIEDKLKELTVPYYKFSNKLPSIVKELVQNQNVKYTCHNAYFPNENIALIAKKTTLHGRSIVTDEVYYEHSSQPCLASSYADGTISLWNLSNNSMIATLERHSGWIWEMETFKVNNMPFLASGSSDHTIKIWDLTSNKLNTTLTGHTGSVRSLSTYQYGSVSYLASSSYDNSIKIWNLNDSILITTITGHAGYVTAIVYFQMNGTHYLASGNNDFKIQIWDLSSYEFTATLDGHDDWIWKLTTYKSKGELFLVSASYDKKIKLWNLNTNNLITIIKENSKSISSLAIYPHNDHPHLVSGDDNGEIMFWNLTDYKHVRTVKDFGHIWSLAFFDIESREYLAVGKDKSIDLWS